MVDWRELREFNDVDLTRSFVLSWHHEGDALVIDVDLFLEPAHPFYEKPRPAEQVCIRPAFIEFPYCVAVSSPLGEAGHPADVARHLGLGAIQGLRVLKDGYYEIDGEFGTVSISAERPILRLKGS